MSKNAIISQGAMLVLRITYTFLLLTGQMKLSIVHLPPHLP